MASGKRSKKLEARIAQMKDNERRLLYKRAARMRKAAKSGEGRARRRVRSADLERDEDRWDESEEPRGLEKRKRRRHGSLSDWAEAVLEDDFARAAEAETEAGSPTVSGLVLEATSGRCDVLLESVEREPLRRCALAPEIAAFQRTDLAVGDRVEVANLEPSGTGSNAPPIVTAVLPRATTLSRPDPGPGGEWVERVIAANIDRVVIVAAARAPALRVRLLDRYLIAIEQGGAQPAIALTKVDLIESAERLAALREKLSPYEELGVPVVPCSILSGQGIPALRALLRGETAVLVGQSGVGKSSLLNALDPELGLATRAVGSANKGRHTTTASTLYALGQDTRIIDTPGIREFGLWQSTPDELRRHFHEFEPFAPSCRFRDCAHLHEPDCAVRAAVGVGIAAARYESYVQLVRAISG